MMLASAHYLTSISFKLRLFRGEIIARGQLNLTDIHIYSENFVRQLMNIAFNYKLQHLSSLRSNFPGLDLGDPHNGIAYQVTARANNEKVNHTLQQVLINRLYEKYPSINLFVLTVKQANYTLNEDTLPYFKFNPTKNIIDMSDFIRRIHGLDFDTIKAIYELVEKELVVL